MSQRINYIQQSPELFRKYLDFSMLLKDSAIEQSIQDLISIRASQINGCAFCVDMHVKEARIHGERELRIHHVAIWRDSTLFAPRERAALAWTEALTLVGETRAPDAVYQALAAHFSAEEQVKLTLLIVAINGWNRIQVGFRAVHPVTQHRVA